MEKLSLNLKSYTLNSKKTQREMYLNIWLIFFKLNILMEIYSVLFKPCVCVCTRTHALSLSVVSDYLQRHGLYPAGPSVHGIFQERYWSGLPFPSPGDVPDSRIGPTSLASPALAGRFFTTKRHMESPFKYFIFS